MPPDSMPYFEDNPYQARDSFMAAAHQGGYKLMQLSTGEKLTEGREHNIATAFKKPEGEAKNLLMLICGTHGVEGYLGHAIQMMVMEKYADELSNDTGLLLVHGLSSGFFEGRRTNTNNVDLNRNAHDDWRKAVTYREEDPGLQQRVDGLIHPRHRREHHEDEKRAFHQGFGGLMRAFQDQYGEEKGTDRFYAAVASGQYDNPKGLFYGGDPKRGREGSITRLDEISEIYGDMFDMVDVVDVHSGLKKGLSLFAETPISAGWAKPYIDKEIQAPEGDWKRNLEHSPPPSDGIVAQVPAQALGYDRVRAFNAEFGTYDIEDVLEALVAENQVHHHGAATPGIEAAVKADLKEAFFPQDPGWRAEAMRLADQFIGGMTQEFGMRK